MNSALVERALKKVPTPEVLVTLVGQCVYQLTESRPKARPLIEDCHGLSAFDIALSEIIDDKITYERVFAIEVSADKPSNQEA